MSVLPHDKAIALATSRRLSVNQALGVSRPATRGPSSSFSRP